MTALAVYRHHGPIKTENGSTRKTGQPIAWFGPQTPKKKQGRTDAGRFTAQASNARVS
jgi:hypothetical protein